MSSFTPENITGKSVDIEHYVAENTAEEAQLTFERVCAKLVNPVSWPSIAGGSTAKFTLLPSKAKEDICMGQDAEWF